MRMCFACDEAQLVASSLYGQRPEGLPLLAMRCPSFHTLDESESNLNNEFQEWCVMHRLWCDATNDSKVAWSGICLTIVKTIQDETSQDKTQ